MPTLHFYWSFALFSFLGLRTCLATTTPPGCRKLPTDSDWPSFEEWEAAIPGVSKENNTDSVGSLPDYRIRAKSYADVQAAVKFSALHKTRISVITTGHDALGRNVAGSGLIVDLSLLQGARVLESFTATAEGVPDLESNEKPQTIVPTDGVQAAVTFNPAFNGLDLNMALAPSNLFFVGGTYGKWSLLLSGRHGKRAKS